MTNLTLIDKLEWIQQSKVLKVRGPTQSWEEGGWDQYLPVCHRTTLARGHFEIF